MNKVLIDKLPLEQNPNICSNECRILVLLEREEMRESMKFSLDTIREAKGYTVDEISERHNIPVEKIREYSEDPGVMPASIVILWRKVYGIPIDYINIET